MQKISIVLLSILLLFSCRKDEIINKVVTEEDPPLVLTVSSFKGKIVDETGDALPGATVRVYQQSTTTDSKGLFQFKNVEAPKGAALVKVEKAGYFSGSAMSGNSAGGQQYTRVTMMKKPAAQQINTAFVANLNWPGGLTVRILPNTLRLANGSVYNGTAEISARWLDPTDPNLGAIMPGALMARDAEGQEQVLATYGMVALEMTTPAGEELLMKTGETVKLEIPIPASLLPKAPNEIPLWYFDLEKERWLLQGACQKSGATYNCQVTTGGYWNCDVALAPICLSGAIFQSDSTPALYTKVIVEDLTDNFIYWGYTDLQGYFCGSVPKGAPLKITILDLCDNVLYEANIGPYSTDTALDDIYLTQTLQQYFIHISCLLNDCSGSPVVDGQLAVQYPGKIRLFPLTAPGVFSADLALNCIEFPELQITGYDLVNFKSTAIQFHSDDSDLNLGALTACDNPPDYINITSDANNYRIAPTRFYLKNNVSSNWMILEGVSTGGTFSIELRQYTGVGTYNSNAFFETVDVPASPLYPRLNAASPDIVVTITADDGQLISGSISGTAYDAFNIPHTLSGDFKVKKEL